MFYLPPGLPPPPGKPPPSFPPGEKPDGMPEKPSDIEAPYSTRYFVLRYSGDGELIATDLKNIAAVTENDTNKYLAIAVKYREGFGYTKGYRYYVVRNDEDKYMAIFLDCGSKLRYVATFAVHTVSRTCK